MTTNSQGLTWEPLDQYTLYPLYSLGLWEAVIWIPAKQANDFTAYGYSGSMYSVCEYVNFTISTLQPITVRKHVDSPMHVQNALFGSEASSPHPP